MKLQTIVLASLLFASCVNAQQTGTAEPKVLLSEANVENAYPRLSKEGKTVLYQSNRSGSWHIYILDIPSGKSTQLTTGNSNNNFPDWDADNMKIAFVSDRDGNEELYIMELNGTGLVRLTEDAQRDIHPYFSPDGKYLLFNSTRGNGSLDIYRMTLADKKTERITDTRSNETCARYSPDMKQMVFLRNDDYSDDVFVMNMGNMVTTNITNDPEVRDGWPAYSNDGAWIYYSSMSSGPYNVFRVKPDGSEKQQLTKASDFEEDARVFPSFDGKTIVYNKRKTDRIEILSITLSKA